MKASDDHDSQPSDRRRHPRGEVAWRIVLERWWIPVARRNGCSHVRLHFSPPDGKPAMTLKGLVCSSA